MYCYYVDLFCTIKQLLTYNSLETIGTGILSHALTFSIALITFKNYNVKHTSISLLLFQVKFHVIVFVPVMASTSILSMNLRPLEYLLNVFFLCILFTSSLG